MSRRNDTIKTIAMLTMLIDHIGLLLLPGYKYYRLLRTIGRIAFPIFAYQVAKGYKHTSNKKNYAKRMLIFGLISQIPYIFLNLNVEPKFQINVILLFLYSLGVLYLFDLFKDSTSFKKIIYLISLLTMILIPNILEYTIKPFMFSYASYGVIMILIFYIFDNKWLPITVSYIGLSIISTYDYASNYLSEHSYELNYFQQARNFEYVYTMIKRYGLMYLEGFAFQARSLMALPIIYIFERVNIIKLNKYIAYTFYPLHITILLLIRFFLGGPII